MISTSGQDCQAWKLPRQAETAPLEQGRHNGRSPLQVGIQDLHAGTRAEHYMPGPDEIAMPAAGRHYRRRPPHLQDLHIRTRPANLETTPPGGDHHTRRTPCQARASSLLSLGQEKVPSTEEVKK
eukprot:g46559.t1